jgi:hypothetical protein
VAIRPPLVTYADLEQVPEPKTPKPFGFRPTTYLIVHPDLPKYHRLRRGQILSSHRVGLTLSSRDVADEPVRPDLVQA